MALDNTCQRICWQPSKSEITLALHQQTAIYKCFEIERDYDYLIMRDPPGAGKTFTILGYIRAYKENENPFITGDKDNFANFINITEFTIIPHELYNSSSNISVIYRNPIIQEEINKLQLLLEYDKQILTNKEIEIHAIFEDPNNIHCTDKYMNIKYNELDNHKLRISTTQNVINTKLNYADSERKSTSINDIRTNKVRNHKSSLIVVPYNIYTQWVDAINSIGGLSYYSYCEYQDITRLYYNPSSVIFEYDIILTTSIYYDTLVIVANQLNIIFDRVIIDEIDSVSKNSNILFGLTEKYDDNLNLNQNIKLDDIKCIKRWYISASININNIYIIKSKGVIISCDNYQNKLLNNIESNNIYDDLLNNFNNNNKYYNSNIFFISIPNIDNLLEITNFLKKIDIITKQDYIDDSFLLPAIQERLYILNNKYIDNILINILDNEQIVQLNANDYKSLKLKYNINIGNSIIEIMSIISKDLIFGIDTCQSQITIINNQLLKIETNKQTNNIRYDNNNLYEEDKNNASTELISIQTKLSYLQMKYDILISRIKENNICMVCYEELDSKLKIIMKCCKNSFCDSCIFRIHKEQGKCPCCRTDFNYSDIVILTNEQQLQTPTPQTPISECNYKMQFSFEIGNYKLENINFNGCEKKILLDKLLNYIIANSSTLCKIMIFTNAHTHITELLDANYSNIVYGIIGLCQNKKDVDKLVLSYKYGNMSILISNPKIYGCGMNFENTTDLIIMHNVSNIHQIIGRAQRYGRTSPLNLWKIFYENENK